MADRSYIKNEYIRLANGTTVHKNKATVAQIREAAKLNPSILDAGYQLSSAGQIILKQNKGTAGTPGSETTDTDVKPGRAWSSLTELEQLQQAQDNINRTHDQNEFNTLTSGGNSGLGRLGDDLNTAINALNTGAKRDTSASVAARSGAGLAQSGVQNRDLKQVATDLATDTGDARTQEGRQRADATATNTTNTQLHSNAGDQRITQSKQNFMSQPSNQAQANTVSNVTAATPAKAAAKTPLVQNGSLTAAAKRSGYVLVKGANGKYQAVKK